MDNDSHVMDLVEIFPFDNNGDCSDVTPSPCHVKVLCCLYLFLHDLTVSRFFLILHLSFITID